MRSFIVVLMFALGGCNSSDNDSALVTQAANEATAVAALRAEVTDLKGKLSQIQLIGHVNGTIPVSKNTRELMAMQGEPTLSAITPSFGPCPDMGVLVGFTNTGDNIGAGALSASYQAFKTCTGYLYETAVGTGNIKTANRIFWDGPNCTGNLLEWEAGGAGYNTQALQNGVVFVNPADGTMQLMVQAKQTPQPILIQSVWVLSNPGCQSDIETQLMYHVIPNDTSITGVPNSTVGNFSLSPP